MTSTSPTCGSPSREASGRRRPLVLLGLFLALAAAGTGVSRGEEYRVGPGDVVQVTVWREEDLSGTFTITPSGTLKHFLLGEVPVAGLTVGAIEERLTRRLAKDYVKDPRVKVAVVEYHARKVYLFGEVAKPGTYELGEHSRLLDVLLQAGGPTGSAGDRLSILRRGKGDSDRLDHVVVDVSRLFLEGDLAQNVPLENGDILYLSRLEKGDIRSRFFESRPNVYYVVGAVKSPGAYEVRPGIKVLDAVLQAGGFTDQAAPNRTKLVREEGGKRDVRKVPMGDVMDRGEKERDVPVQAGDLIIVPESWF